MTAVSHNWLGITDGVTLTSGSGGNTNTAGNNYIDGLDRPASGVLQASKASAFDEGMGVAVAIRGTAGVCDFNWQGQLGAITNDHFNRVIFRAGALPQLNTPIIQMYNAALAVQVAQIRIDGVLSATPGAIDLEDSAGSLVTTSGFRFIAGNWYRIEWQVHPSGTVSYVTIRLYADPFAPVDNFTEELNGGASPVTWAGAADNSYIACGIYTPTDTNVPSATEVFSFCYPKFGWPVWVGPTRTKTDYSKIPKKLLQRSY